MLQWYSLSDPAMEDALVEFATIRRFAGIYLFSDRIPDEATILAFRHLLEKHDLGQKIFKTVKAYLKQRGVATKQRTIIDATLISAPSSTKNKTGERDPEMHQTKKGNQWYYRFAGLRLWHEGAYRCRQRFWPDPLSKEHLGQCA